MKIQHECYVCRREYYCRSEDEQDSGCADPHVLTILEYYEIHANHKWCHLKYWLRPAYYQRRHNNLLLMHLVEGLRERRVFDVDEYIRSWDDQDPLFEGRGGTTFLFQEEMEKRQQKMFQRAQEAKKMKEGLWAALDSEEE